MIRYEIKTKNKTFVGCEATLAEALAYVDDLKKNGVEIVTVEYFDNDQRVRDIRAGS